MAYTFANLKTPRNVESGVADFVYIAPVKDFAEGGIKCPPSNPGSTPGAEIVVVDTHVLKPGKIFAQFLLAPEKNELGATTIGDTGFQKLNIELKIFIPGSYAEVHEAVKNIINTPLIVLAKDSNCPANMYYQLGCDCVYAWAKFDFTTGTTVSGVKGYSGTITYQNGYIQLYEGGINGGAGGGDITNKFTAYWGWISDGSPNPTEADILASTNKALFNKTKTISANYMANTSPNLLWMAEPLTEPAKTKWYASALNNGNIDTGELFEDPVTIGAFRFYISAYPTQNTTSAIEFRVS